MDAHNLRILADHCLPLLHEARIEKIHGPMAGVLVFSLFAKGYKVKLVMRHERQQPLFFFTSRRISNPLQPTAQVMRLRKYCAGKRLGRGIADFSRRSLAFPFGTPEWADSDAKLPRWLVLDLVNGPKLCRDLEPDFGAQPLWPDHQLVDSLCAIPWQKRSRDGPWQEYAVLTPFLRETLAALEPLEGRALMVDLEYGGDRIFLYGNEYGDPRLYSAWPLPDQISGRKGLIPLDCEQTIALPEEDDDSIVLSTAPEAVDSFLALAPVLSCARLVDEAAFFRDLGSLLQNEEQKPRRKESKRLTRLHAKLEQEEARLNAMLARREDAKALQAVLWQFEPEQKLAAVTVPEVEGQPGTRVIQLDPLLSVRENMTHMFRQSARGMRGLTMLRRRRLDLEQAPGMVAGDEKPTANFREVRRDEMGTYCAQVTPAAANGALPPDPGDRPPLEQFRFQMVSVGKAALQPFGGKDLRANALVPPRPVEEAEGQSRYPGVARFVSADGYTLLRGRNAKGNHSLMKIGSGHDLWLHAESVPSAHVLIRRSHAADEVPERTLLQAGLLVAEKSAQRFEAKASVMVAQLRYVHGIKGASLGTVKVDKVQQTLLVPMDGLAQTVGDGGTPAHS